MSKILKIAVSIVIIFVITAPSCDEENTVTDEQEIFDMKQEILKDFSSEYLTEAEQFAHEQKAIQLLYDVHDYRKLISDTTLDMDYRETIGRLLLQSYVTNAVTGFMYNDEGNRESNYEDNLESVLIEQSVNGYLNNSTEYLITSIDSVRVETPLQRTGENKYAGELAYVRTTIGTHNQIDHLSSSEIFYVIKGSKKFGNETMLVWQVKLGGFSTRTLLWE